MTPVPPPAPPGPSSPAALPWKGAQPPPMGPPLPAGDPWVRALSSLFPRANPSDLGKMASAFRDNMFSFLNQEIKRNEKKSKENAEKIKKAFKDP